MLGLNHTIDIEKDRIDVMARESRNISIKIEWFLTTERRNGVSGK